MADAFTVRLDDGQGRVQPSTVAPADGAWAVVLGDDTPGWRESLDVGDYVQIEQDLDVTNIALVRPRLAFRMPAGLPPGLVWQVAILVDGAVQVVVTARPGTTRVLSDLAANVVALGGVHRVGVRLELASA